MATKKKSGPASRSNQQMMPPVLSKVAATKDKRSALAKGGPVCDDSCALNAHQAWKSWNLPAAFNSGVTFTVPAGKRFVIELVTASFYVPAGEAIRLRMFTSTIVSVSNIDLAVTPQGVVNGKAVFVATHSLRAYADTLLQFNINRDNAITTGSALICVSGYLVSL